MIELVSRGRVFTGEVLARMRLTVGTFCMEIVVCRQCHLDYARNDSTGCISTSRDCFNIKSAHRLPSVKTPVTASLLLGSIRSTWMVKSGKQRIMISARASVAYKEMKNRGQVMARDGRMAISHMATVGHSPKIKRSKNAMAHTATKSSVMYIACVMFTVRKLRL